MNPSQRLWPARAPDTLATIVALHRVAKLAERHEATGRPRILLTTFTIKLARQREALLRDLGGQELLSKVNVRGSRCLEPGRPGSTRPRGTSRPISGVTSLRRASPSVRGACLSPRRAVSAGSTATALDTLSMFALLMTEEGIAARAVLACSSGRPGWWGWEHGSGEFTGRGEDPSSPCVLNERKLVVQ